MRVLSVSQINFFIKSLIEGDGRMRDIYARGEISNFTDHYRSGHLYFSLKDEKSVLKAVMFSSAARRLRFCPKEGMRVIVRGRVAVYEPGGQYQFYVEEMQPDGVGALSLAFEQLKEKLAAEGLFAEEHKRPIPPFPARIGVITSPTGAAVQDIRNILSRRWPAAEIVFCPVLVQGEDAAAQLTAAVKLMNAQKAADVIIIGRGGGSAEDLAAFNDETLARAVFASKIPVISAVGHETDFTICDFVADLRAPTPSAAAELAVPDREEQKRILLDLQQNIRKNMQNRLDLCYNGLEQYNFVLEQGPARQSWQKKHDLLQRVKDEFRQKMQTQQNDAELQLQHAAALAGSLNPYKVLARGYAMVTTANGAILDAEGLQPEKTIYVRSVSHRAKCRVEAVEEINENTQKF